MSPDDIAFRLILRKIERASSLDFTNYKDKCLKRRIRVRQRALDIHSYKEYFDFLQNNDEEMDTLIDTITINVTQFFRDYTAFKYLQSNVFIPYSEDKNLFKLRIWSAACASGEEPYSIAISLCESFGRKIERVKIDIFATDIDDKSLKIAEKGIYPAKNVRVLLDKEPEILPKYFDKQQDGQYKVKDSIKEMIQFKKRDLIKDAHFSRINILFCRNLFIYFEKTLQEEILKKFHNDLKDNGYLVLGKVETILGIGESYFKSLSVKERIYKKKVKE